MLPIIKIMAPKSIVTLKQIGDAMINATTKGYEKKILEVKDIIMLSKTWNVKRKTWDKVKKPEFDVSRFTALLKRLSNFSFF